MPDTVKVPVVPDMLAAVTVRAVFDGGLVPAKQEPFVFAVHVPETSMYCRHAG
jgi:hypothetical protein